MINVYPHWLGRKKYLDDKISVFMMNGRHILRRSLKIVLDKFLTFSLKLFYDCYTIQFLPLNSLVLAEKCFNNDILVFIAK